MIELSKQTWFNVLTLWFQIISCQVQTNVPTQNNVHTLFTLMTDSARWTSARAVSMVTMSSITLAHIAAVLTPVYILVTFWLE